MEIFKNLALIKEVYERGGNIIQYLKSLNQQTNNSPGKF